MINDLSDKHTHLLEADWERVDESSRPQDYADYLELIERHASLAKHRESLLGLLPIKSGDHFLDAGCGLGPNSRFLAKLVGEEGLITGIDKSKVMIEAARKIDAEAGSAKITYDIGDLYQLPYADESFDGIIVDRVFIHLQDPGQALHEFMRVLKPSGCVAISEPDWSSFAITPDSPSARLLMKGQMEVFQNGAFGKDLGDHLEQVGFELQQDFHKTKYSRGVDPIWKMMNLERAVNQLLAKKVLSKDEVVSMKAEFKQAEMDGRFSMLFYMHYCLIEKKGSP